MSWMAPCDELGDRREPVGLGNSVGSNADAALTFKAGHGRVVNEPLDRAAREREFDAVHRTPLRESLARKPIRGKLFTLEFHCHRDFPASPWCACAQWPQSRPWYCGCSPGRRSPNRLSPGTNDVRCVSFRRRQLTVIRLRHVAIKIHTR